VIEVLSPALAVAFVITLLEMTEVVALVFALGADHTTLRHGALGAVSGTAVIALVAIASGAAILALPQRYLLWAATVTLVGFAFFLFRSTVRTYRRARAERSGTSGGAPKSHAALQFAGGFSVGAVETTEAVIVLLALTAAGSGVAAVVGALAGGAVLVTVAFLLHERIRRIKVPLLKLGATSMLFAFAVFWAGEAAGLHWPGSDLVLLPLFFLGLLIVRGGVALAMRERPTPPPAAA
jgi:Ca2+/H+ antiporter, TMEM165/GDT1 family